MLNLIILYYIFFIQLDPFKENNLLQSVLIINPQQTHFGTISPETTIAQADDTLSNIALLNCYEHAFQGEIIAHTGKNESEFIFT
jgi:hypothetical protein